MKAAQRLVLSSIRNYIKTNGYSPSVKDISSSLCVFPNAVQEQIKRLEAGGYITRTSGVARSIRLTDLAESIIQNDIKEVAKSLRLTEKAESL